MGCLEEIQNEAENVAFKVYIWTKPTDWHIACVMFELQDGLCYICMYEVLLGWS